MGLSYPFSLVDNLSSLAEVRIVAGMLAGMRELVERSQLQVALSLWIKAMDWPNHPYPFRLARVGPWSHAPMPTWYLTR